MISLQHVPIDTTTDGRLCVRLRVSKPKWQKFEDLTLSLQPSLVTSALSPQDLMNMVLEQFLAAEERRNLKPTRHTTLATPNRVKNHPLARFDNRAICLTRQKAQGQAPFLHVLFDPMTDVGFSGLRLGNSLLCPQDGCFLFAEPWTQETQSLRDRFVTQMLNGVDSLNNNRNPRTRAFTNPEKRLMAVLAGGLRAINAVSLDRQREERVAQGLGLLVGLLTTGVRWPQPGEKGTELWTRRAMRWLCTLQGAVRASDHTPVLRPKHVTFDKSIPSALATTSQQDRLEQEAFLVACEIFQHPETLTASTLFKPKPHPEAAHDRVRLQKQMANWRNRFCLQVAPDLRLDTPCVPVQGFQGKRAHMDMILSYAPQDQPLEP